MCVNYPTVHNFLESTTVTKPLARLFDPLGIATILIICLRVVASTAGDPVSAQHPNYLLVLTHVT